MDFPFGHIPLKMTIPLGARVRLDAGRRQLSLLEAVIR
jgi:muramoyltetrapeptide carboxypeptidase LdcA involved in peptidoglycan recycling